MLSGLIPTCQISNQVSNKCCVNQKCKLPAFVCKYCQKHQCQKMHSHDGKLQTIHWDQLQQLILNSRLNIEDYQELEYAIIKLEDQIKKLVTQLNLITKNYQVRMKDIRDKMRFDQKVDQVMTKLRQKKYNKISGKQMNMLYQHLKQQTYLRNANEIESLQKKQGEHIKNVLDKIRQSIEQYNFKDQEQQKLKKYTKLIKLNPKKSQLYLDRGIFYKNRNQFQNALEDYNKAIQLDPKNSNAYNNRGNVYKAKKQMLKALADYTKAIECDPDNALAYNNKGVIYESQNELQKAVIEYTNAIDCDEEYSLAYNNRGDVYKKKKMYNQAIKDYTKAIEYNSTTKSGYKNRAYVYRKLNMIKEAEEDQRQLQELIKK